MAESVHPALERFASQLGNELVLGQVLITRREHGYELRHADDASLPAAELRLLRTDELRAWAQTTASGAFRPLKAAPNLRGGWRSLAATDSALGSALDRFYPGAIADWAAAQSEQPPITHFHEFVNRQTGIYRVAQRLTDPQAAQVIRAGCEAGFCLKRRLWTVDGLAPDPAGEKSLIPCLELCAVLLELARQASRLEQAERVRLDLSSEDVETIRAALAVARAHPDPGVREGDLRVPSNPRRIQLALEKLPRLPESREGNDGSKGTDDI